MQTFSMLGMAYHIKKLFHVKLGKKDNKNGCNDKNTKKNNVFSGITADIKVVLFVFTCV